MLLHCKAQRHQGTSAGSLSLQGSTRAHLIAALYELHSYLLPGRLIQGQLHEAEGAAVQVPYLAYTPHKPHLEPSEPRRWVWGAQTSPQLAVPTPLAQTLLGCGDLPQPKVRVGRAGLCLPAHSRGAQTHLLILGVRPQRLHVVLHRHVGPGHWAPPRCEPPSGVELRGRQRKPSHPALARLLRHAASPACGVRLQV